MPPLFVCPVQLAICAGLCGCGSDVVSLYSISFLGCKSFGLTISLRRETFVL